MSPKYYIQSLGFKASLSISIVIFYVLYRVQLESVSWSTLILGGLIHSRGPCQRRSLYSVRDLQFIKCHRADHVLGTRSTRPYPPFWDKPTTHWKLLVGHFWLLLLPGPGFLSRASRSNVYILIVLATTYLITEVILRCQLLRSCKSILLILNPDSQLS